LGSHDYWGWGYHESRSHRRRDYNRPSVAYRSADQLARRRRIESLIRLAAPVLDLVLYAGDRASRIVGRNEIGPEPARRTGLPPAKRD
jgi:hypothetical protein